MIQETKFSPCRKYRYTLWREWQPEFRFASITEDPDATKDGFVMFIGLNPSTADEIQDDPTIRRCVDFAKSWGYTSMCMTNLFAYRATMPEEMKLQIEPIGAENDGTVKRLAREACLIVAAWGTHGKHMDRQERVKHWFASQNIQMHHLGLNSDGTPKHPLYLRKTTEPLTWN